jgi:hypothetical protein
MSDARTGIEEPPDDTPIWRYMDLARFVTLVSSRRMWFSKLRQFWVNDPWEGFGRAKGLRGPWRDARKHVPASEFSELMYRASSAHASSTIRKAAEHVYASPWCQGSESLGMWERYAGGATGVAIESTIGDFKRALKREIRPEQFAFGSVKHHADVAKAEEVRSDFTKGAIPLERRIVAACSGGRLPEAGLLR